MISSEVQRTLVKSPPELWAELSDPASLARHLGELGEIRITRAEPEKRVEWEAGTTSGSVIIKPSGWGTKVTLSVTRELEPAGEAEPTDDAHAEPEPAVEPVAEAEPIAEAEAEPSADHAVEPEPPVAAEAEPIGEPEHPPEPTVEAEPEPPRGFFARLFGRRRARAAAPSGPLPVEEPAEAPQEPAEAPQEPAEAPLESAEAPLESALDAEASPGAVEIAAAAPAQGGLSAIESLQARFQSHEISPPELAAVEEVRAETVQPPAQSALDIAAELRTAEEAAVEEVTAVLTAVLDRLGAAHHRPFSRS